MATYEVWVFILICLVALQLLVVLLLFWRARRSVIFIGSAAELLFWIALAGGVLANTPLEIHDVSVKALAVYCLIRSFTLAATFMGNPERDRSRWSYLFEADDENLKALEKDSRNK